jgi:hypothetical protein
VTSPVLFGIGVPKSIVYLYDLHIVVGGISTILSGSSPVSLMQRKIQVQIRITIQPQILVIAIT